MEQQQSTKKSCFKNVVKTLIILQVCVAINDATSFSKYVFPNYIEVSIWTHNDDVYCVGCVNSKIDPHYALTEKTTLEQIFRTCKTEWNKTYVEIYNSSYYYV